MNIGLTLAAVLTVLKLMHLIHLSWLWIIASCFLDPALGLVFMLFIGLLSLLGIGGLFGGVTIINAFTRRRRRLNRGLNRPGRF